MKVGVVGLSLSLLDFTDLLDFIRDVGGSCLELCTVKGAHNNTLDLSAGNLMKVKKNVSDRGLLITSVAGYNDFTLPNLQELKNQVEQLRWYCQLAVDLDVKVVRVLSGDNQSGELRSEYLSNIITGMKMAVGMAEELDLTLALENHGCLVNDAPALLQILNEVASERLKITLDTGNFVWAGHSLADSYRYFEMLAPYIANVHLKDFISENGQVRFVPLGQGMLDFNQLFQILQAVGYQETFLCEYEGAGEPKNFLKEGSFNRKRLVVELKQGTKESLDYIRSIFKGS